MRYYVIMITIWMIYFLLPVDSLSFERRDDLAYFAKILAADYGHENIRVYKFLEAQKNSYIIFIQDREGNHYVVKQEKQGGLSRHFRAISEVLCAHIAFNVSIPAHRVTLLPIEMVFPGKFITQRVATLHTLVPGDTIRALQDSKYCRLDIKQSTDTDVPFEHQGFNERVIFYMSLHPQLIKIVALDTFIGNKDRNKSNMLYDSETDTFYAIDMALMYNVFGRGKSVSCCACEQVIRMIEQKKKFTESERMALIEYRSVLQELVQNFPPKRMNELLDELVMESGLIGALSPFDENAVRVIVNMYKRAIKESYTNVKKLIYLLYILIYN